MTRLSGVVPADGWEVGPKRLTPIECTTRTTNLCEASFQRAAAVSDMQDVNEDLFAAVVNCSLAQAETMSAKYPLALDGVPPSTYFGNVCNYYADVSVSAATFRDLLPGTFGTVGETAMCREIG